MVSSYLVGLLLIILDCSALSSNDPKVSDMSVICPINLPSARPFTLVFRVSGESSFFSIGVDFWYGIRSHSYKRGLANSNERSMSK